MRKPLSFFLVIMLIPLFSYAEKQLLENRDWLLSLEKRTLLKFITECALRKDQVLAVKDEGLIFEYYGSLGVAPDWDGYPSSLSTSEQRWVSACVLARVNYYGTPVPINLRTSEESGFFMPVTATEIESFPLHEGGFFGNIFASPQKKYVCRGKAQNKVLVTKNRICSLPQPDKERGLKSACGYIIVGDCDDTSVFMRDGINYQEVIHAWLRPD